MIEPQWIEVHEVIAIHDIILERMDGLEGFPNPGYLESAVAAPRHSFHYSDGGLDLFDLAAVYLFHIAKNHAFADANKRTAYVTALLFLQLNEVYLVQPDNALELAQAVVKAAKSETLEKEPLAALMRDMAGRSPRATKKM